MKRVLAVLSFLLFALPATAPASAKEFDLGFWRENMMLGTFRFGAWPPGTAIHCSDDIDRPRELDRVLIMPRQLADVGGVRCALLQAVEKNAWKPAARRIGTTNVEVAAMFGPDAAGTKKMVQLFLTAPRSGFDSLVAHFTSRLGPPTETTERLVRWHNGKAEAVVMHEEADTATAMIVDWPMQQLMNQKLQRK